MVLWSFPDAHFSSLFCFVHELRGFSQIIFFCFSSWKGGKVKGCNHNVTPAQAGGHRNSKGRPVTPAQAGGQFFSTIFWIPDQARDDRRFLLFLPTASKIRVDHIHPRHPRSIFSFYIVHYSFPSSPLSLCFMKNS